MRALRHHQIISGFWLEYPVPGLPALTHCGEALCSPRHQLRPHAHTGYEFVYISRGHAFWQMKDGAVHQKMGDLLVTPPRELHATAGEPGVEFHLLWIGLDLRQMGREGRALERKLIARRPSLLPHCQDVEGVLRGIAAQAASERPLRDRVVHNYLRTFIRLVEQRLEQPAVTAPAAASFYSRATARALDFMREHLDRRASVREMAKAGASGSVARFCAKFKREVGVSPGVHHMRLRLDEARQALRQPDSRVTHVAMRYGFSSSQHFSTAFRRTFGVTPREWQVGANAK